MQTLELKDKRKIIFDGDFMTVKRRRDIKNIFSKQKVTLKDDAVTLAMLEAKYKVKPPTQQQIFEDYLSLVNPNDEETNEPEYQEELTRCCCKWLNADGSQGAFLTKEEFDALPFEMGLYIGKNLFTEAERSFLVVPQV